MNYSVAFLFKYLSVGYFDGKLHELSVSNAGDTIKREASEDYKPHILIVARQFYTEHTRSYQISDKRELKKLLALNNTENEITLINSELAQEYWVTQWSLNKEVPAAKFTIPESYLFTGQASDILHIIENKQAQKELFVLSGKKGIFSSLATPLVNSPARFLNSCGQKVEDVESQVYTPDVFFSQMHRLLQKLPIKSLVNFYTSTSSTRSVQDIKSMLVVPAAIFAAYLAVTSAGLAAWNYHLENKVNSYASEVTDLLLQDEKNEERLAKASALFNANRHEVYSLEVWPVIHALIGDAKISRISYDGKRFLVAGEAAKATDILARLSEQPMVTDAQFDLPVSSNRALERFTISFELESRS